MGGQRDGLAKFLKDRGIETLVHWAAPNHRQPDLKSLHHFSLPVTERLSGEVLSLPCHPFLRDQELDTVVRAISDFYAQG